MDDEIEINVKGSTDTVIELLKRMSTGPVAAKPDEPVEIDPGKSGQAMADHMGIPPENRHVPSASHAKPDLPVMNEKPEVTCDFERWRPLRIEKGLYQITMPDGVIFKGVINDRAANPVDRPFDIIWR